MRDVKVARNLLEKELKEKSESEFTSNLKINNLTK